MTLEKALRDLIRDRLDVDAHVGGTVGGGEQIELFRIDDSDDLSTTPTDHVKFQFNVWGDESAEECGRLRDRLRSLLRGLAGEELEGRNLLGARITGCRWLPDPVSNRPRFALTAAVSVIEPAAVGG